MPRRDRLPPSRRNVPGSKWTVDEGPSYRRSISDAPRRTSEKRRSLAVTCAATRGSLSGPLTVPSIRPDPPRPRSSKSVSSSPCAKLNARWSSSRRSSLSMPRARSAARSSMRSVPRNATRLRGVCSSEGANRITPASSANFVRPETGIGNFAFPNATAPAARRASPSPCPPRMSSFFQEYASVPVARPRSPVSSTSQSAKSFSSETPRKRRSTDIGYGSPNCASS